MNHDIYYWYLMFLSLYITAFILYITASIIKVSPVLVSHQRSLMMHMETIKNIQHLNIVKVLVYNGKKCNKLLRGQICTTNSKIPIVLFPDLPSYLIFLCSVSFLETKNTFNHSILSDTTSVLYAFKARSLGPKL